MVDFPPLQRPGMVPEPPSKKQDRSVDDQFQKEMQKKVEKVSETDQEQKKKRKRKEESEEDELPSAPPEGPTTPASQVTPFSLSEQSKKISPLEMGEDSATSPLASAQPTEPSALPPSFIAPVSSTEEMEDNAGFLEQDSSAFMGETAYIESISTKETRPSYESTPPPSSFQAPSEKQTNPSSSDESEEPTTQEKQKEKTEAPQKQQGKKKDKTASATKEQEGVFLPQTGKKGVKAEDLDSAASKKAEESSGYFEAKRKEKKTEKLKKEGLPVEGDVIPITPLPPSTYIEKEKKQTKEAGVLSAALSGIPPLAASPGTLPSSGVKPPAPIVNPYANLHPEVMELFDKMVGTMSVMSLSGVKETVMTLNAPKFAASVFFGAQIIIKEYSTAPLAFNVQINTSPEGLALAQGNAATLMAAFQYGNYNFRVHRLETGLTTEKPLVRRKEPPAGGKGT